MYKLFKTMSGTESVQRLSDMSFIPFDEANTDYQEYLKWLSESPDNKPLPAEGTA